MTQGRARIAIVGGGLSGLCAAFLLEQKGLHDWVLFEGRDTLGGRVLSLPFAAGAGAAVDRFDVGPAWFWPDFQPQLDRLVVSLGLERFAQFESGDMVVERSTQEPPMRMRADANEPASMRLAGGMGSLIHALSGRLDQARLLTGHTVHELHCSGSGVALEGEDADGEAISWQADHVLLATPPRLACQRIRFTPALPAPLQQQWQGTATWMAAHAKYVAVYDTPFWRDQGLSGQARSRCGPLVEIHDASVPKGCAALFGFVGVPARVRQGLSEDVLRTHCLAQLTRLFGTRAANPRAEFLKDWSADLQTATAHDLDGGGQHARAPIAAPEQGPWQGRVMGIASEWSPRFPGYLAGCLDAATLGVEALAERVKRLTPQTETD